MKIKTLYFLFAISIIYASCSKSKSDPPPPDNFIKGADVSWLTQMEAFTRKFYNASGNEQECMSILKSLGMNTIRLRVWVNPALGWNNKADVLTKAIRARDLGMKLLINFHYSDTWADPGNQEPPAAWAAYGLSEMKTALTSHTTDVLQTLKQNGINPEWIQVGNETNDGMLWPIGRASQNMSNFANLINAGYDAVKSVFPTAKVIVHCSNGWDNNLFRWLFDGLQQNGGKWDIIGLSLYPTPSNWQTLNSQCLQNMNDLVNRYNTEVMVVETGMSWDQATTCRSFLADLIDKTRSVSGGKGLGVLYWEPQAYGNWQGYTLGAFDNSGKPTEALEAFN